MKTTTDKELRLNILITQHVNNTVKIALVDVLVITAVFFIPALAHGSSYKLYYFEPMRLLLFSALLLCNNTLNACILAVLLPLVSTFLPPHHPPFYKAIIMSAELLVNVLCFVTVARKSKWPLFVLFFISTVISKLFYYGLKYVIMKAGLISGELVSTGLDIQLATLTVLSLLFALLYKRQNTSA